MAMQYETISIEKNDQIAWITLDRPQQMNAFAGEMRDELLQALLETQSDDELKVVVLTGAGKWFCAGGDIRQMVEMKEQRTGFEKLRPLLDAGRRIVTVMHEMPKPVIAMVNGPASGAGANLALACDLRIASDHASFTQSFVHVGLHPDWGGSFFLPRLVGTGRALELMWTGRRVEAEEAEEIGLVQQVVPHAHLREHTQRFARRLAKAPPHALRLIKMAIYSSGQFDLQSMLEIETEAQQQCWEAQESHEQMEAYANRRHRRLFEKG
jgi:2-(1,2-epoxy-1,2-dihydrophenyl)acetyl-CoA isomerase